MTAALATPLPSGPDTKNGNTFLYVNIPLLVAAVLIVGFRVWWRCIRNGGGALNKADICVVVCLIFNIIQVACISSAILNWGFGHHAKFLTAEQRFHSLLLFFVFQCFVKNTVGITKLSFLFLYLDIFPQKKFRIICWALIVQISAGLVAMSLTTIFQCTPVRFSWDKTIPGECINIKAFWYGQSGWNTLMDVVVLVLPIPVIVKLQMNRQAKLGLLLVFILGMFVCVTSVERLISLNFNATFALDFTWATGTSVIWTQVEATVGVICACAPSLRIPLARFVPFIFGSAKQDQSYPLSDGGYRGTGAPSGSWKDQSNRTKRRGGTNVEIDELETSYHGEGSEERITGIKKTVSIELTYVERPGDTDTEATETYERHRPV
ncbi:putative PTH11-typeG-protein-coupled receptor [Xylogone sp. PMI_703]|nr:putative PTH11-typeG-protein-coupled receptor [Xylogone sp. PMI_703]